MRAVSVARRSAVKAKTQAINQSRALLVSAPQDDRDRLLKRRRQNASRVVPVRSLGKTLMLQTLTATQRLLAKRWLMLAEELKALDTILDSLTTQHARRLRERFGVGPQTAAVLVAVAGDNPERLKSEAALAALCGTSPLQASSGKTVRHRLNRGGDRCKQRPLDHRHSSNAQGSAHPRLCRTPDEGRHVQQGNPPLLQALCRPGVVPAHSGRSGRFDGLCLT
jgi:transposase